MNTEPTYLFAIWEVAEGNLEDVLKSLAEATVKSRGEEGNLFYNVHQEITNPNRIVLSEGYKSEAALEEHRNSSHFKEVVLGEIVPKLKARSVIVSHRVDYN